MKSNIGLSDRIVPYSWPCKEYDVTEYKADEKFGTSNDLYSLIDDSNNRWVVLDKFHYIRRT
jgi:hypothetical protein